MEKEGRRGRKERALYQGIEENYLYFLEGRPKQLQGSCVVGDEAEDLSIVDSTGDDIILCHDIEEAKVVVIEVNLYALSSQLSLLGINLTSIDIKVKAKKMR